MMRAAAVSLASVTLLVAGCGNFFPNPDNIALPSRVRDYELVCGATLRVDCEGRAAGLVEQKRRELPALRVVKVRIEPDMGYTITFSDGTSESMIVD